MIRLSWHAAGTYRIEDGRGGAGDGSQRFAPLNSWPDNAQPRQGPPAAVAGQAEVRPEDLVGRPAGARRQRRAGGHGLRDLRLRLRPRGHLGARGDLLGPRGHLARRRALQRRARARRAARRGPDGPHLRQPRGPERRARPAQGGPRHPRDVPPDGDERRGDRRADRRRPHVRQDPRCRRPATWSAPSPRAARSIGQGLGWKSSHGTGKGADAITIGLEVTWTSTPTQWGNGFFDNLFGYEWELDEEPGRRPPVGGQGRRGDHPRRPRQARKRQADDAHDRPGAPDRPGVREDLAPVPREPRRVPARVRQGLVQAAAPRHGSGRRATSARGSPSRSCGRTRSRPSRATLVSDADVADLKAQGARLRPDRRPAGPTAWASAASFRDTDKRGGANGARIRLAPQKDWEVNEPAELADGARDAGAGPAGVQRRRRRPGLAGRPDRAGGLARRSRRRPRTPATT